MIFGINVTAFAVRTHHDIFYLISFTIDHQLAMMPFFWIRNLQRSTSLSCPICVRVLLSQHSAEILFANCFLFISEIIELGRPCYRNKGGYRGKGSVWTSLDIWIYSSSEYARASETMRTSAQFSPVLLYAFVQFKHCEYEVCFAFYRFLVY